MDEGQCLRPAEKSRRDFATWIGRTSEQSASANHQFLGRRSPIMLNRESCHFLSTNLCCVKICLPGQYLGRGREVPPACVGAGGGRVGDQSVAPSQTGQRGAQSQRCSAMMSIRSAPELSSDTSCAARGVASRTRANRAAEPERQSASATARARDAVEPVDS